MMPQRRRLLKAAIVLLMLTVSILHLQGRCAEFAKTRVSNSAAKNTFKSAWEDGSSRLEDQSRPEGVHHEDAAIAKANPMAQKIDWSRYAYILYATDPTYLCTSVMMIEQLHRLGARADRVLLYPDILMPDESTYEGSLIVKARDEYEAVVKPVQLISKLSNESGGQPARLSYGSRLTKTTGWARAYTKLLAFNQTEYERVLHLDSDATVLQPMDELFLLPDTLIAMPRAYWLPQTPDITLTSDVMLAKPSTHTFIRLLHEAQMATKDHGDMGLLNRLFRHKALLLPHHIYTLLTGTFRNEGDRKALSDDELQSWNPDEALGKAKYVHFSDWPVEKPWMRTNERVWEEALPKCYDVEGKMQNGTDASLCREREIWVGLYENFRKRKQRVCDVERWKPQQDPQRPPLSKKKADVMVPPDGGGGEDLKRGVGKGESGIRDTQEVPGAGI